MALQSSLFGDDEQVSNVFFALLPDAPAAAQLSALAQQLHAQHQLTAKIIDAARLHLSLCQVGEFAGPLPQSVLEAARRAAATLAFPVFDLSFERVRSYPRQDGNPLVLLPQQRNAELEAFQQALVHALATAGLKQRMSGFAPHLTLLYDRKMLSDEPLVSRVRWTARDFVLVRSLVNRSTYELLGSWPFRA